MYKKKKRVVCRDVYSYLLLTNVFTDFLLLIIFMFKEENILDVKINLKNII